MNNILGVIALLFLLSCTQIGTVNTPKNIDAGLKSATSWFQAWELVSKETYHVNAATPVKLVLFDEKYVYTTSDVTGAGGEKDEIKQKNLARQAISLLEQRQKGILAKDKKDLGEIDNYWLTLEGLGQYSTYAWLTNPKGGNMSHEKALPILKTKWWSQEEGFPICYLLAKYGGTETWWKSFFCRNPKSPISLLKANL